MIQSMKIASAIVAADLLIATTIYATFAVLNSLWHLLNIYYKQRNVQRTRRSKLVTNANSTK